MTFNNKRGKTEYMVMGKGNDEIRTVTATIKKGHIPVEQCVLGIIADDVTRHYGSISAGDCEFVSEFVIGQGEPYGSVMPQFVCDLQYQ